MKVEAKCIAKAWDSTTATFYYPGEVYEIEHDSPLASLKVGIKYVFEFDRNPTRTDEGVMVEKDYSCKKCGKAFDNLSSLGRHTRMAHRYDTTEAEDVPQ